MNMENTKKKIIGVLGGMGPEATAELYLRIVKIFQQRFGAKYDDDFPEMILLNLPIPDVVEGLKSPEKTLKILVNGAKKLESIGVNFIVMPCNTAHYFYVDINSRYTHIH